MVNIEFLSVVGGFELDIKTGKIGKKKVKKRVNKLNITEKRRFLDYIKNKDLFRGFIEKNIKISQERLIKSINEENLITQAVSNIQELDKCINMLCKRLREWYSIYLPELNEEVEDNNKFIELVLRKNKAQLLQVLKVSKEDCLGKDIEKSDLNQIKFLAGEIENMFKLRKKHLDYLDELMKKYMPNTQEVAGTMISAKLLAHAGSLLRLVEFPSSTIQLLGAEKALFRHLTKGAKCPKYGIIISHELVSKAKNKGKMARVLADKISICIKVDYFKGEFIGDKFKEKLENMKI